MDFFKVLSQENIYDIAKLLDLKSLCRLIMTSKELKDLCDTNDMWKFHYLLTIKDKWKITENSIHINNGFGDFIYLYEFNDGESKIIVKSTDSPNGYIIRNMECPFMWDYKINVKYLGIYRGETPLFVSPYYYHNEDYIIRSGCMKCQYDLIKKSGIIYKKPDTMRLTEWREDIHNKWKQLNKDNGLVNSCQNPMHYDIDTLEIPGSCKGFKNYKKVIIKKLYTKQKNNNKYKKYINEEKKYKQSIEMYKEQIKYSQEQIKISKQLAEKEKDKLKRLEEAIKFV